MNLFCHPSVWGAKALIEHHFWKFEITMENFSLYSTFFSDVHVVMTVSSTDTSVCIYSSVNKYKLQSYDNLSVIPSFTLGNDIYSLRVRILHTRKAEDDEDVIYESYDTQSMHYMPTHKLFFNSAILHKYDWTALKVDTDYKLVNLDPYTFKEPAYIVDRCPFPFRQLLCNKDSASNHCNHMAKRMKYISGGYKEILFDITTERALSCPCSFFMYIKEQNVFQNFNFILLSYKLTQFLLNF